MKLMIGVPTGDDARRGAEFYECFNLLEKPKETLILFSRGQSPARNRNLIAQAALDNDCTHILYIDDDMIFEKDVLNKILVHADKDVVSGLYLMKRYPHFPAVFDEARDDGKCKVMALTQSKTGLVRVVNCGFGFVLIKTQVFRLLEKPWVTLGEVIKDEWSDDMAFFNKVRKAGFKIYCDLDIQLGHMLNVTLRPIKDSNIWNAAYVTQTGQMFTFPQLTGVSPAFNAGRKVGEK